MIDRVHFENFKSLENLTLELGRFTVLVGANGCGKSSVLQAIHLLSQTGSKTEGEPDAMLGRFWSIYGGARAPRRIIYRGEEGKITLAMRSSDGDELKVVLHVRDAGSTVFAVNVDVGPDAPLHAAISPSASWSEELVAVLDHDRVRRFAPAVYLHLDASEMVLTSVPEDEVPRMEPDGSGLASVLAWMKGAAEDEIAAITSDLGKVVAGVKRIRTLPERVIRQQTEKLVIDGQPVFRPVTDTRLGDRFSIEFDDGSEVPADLLSEGTVLALGLLTKLHEPSRPRLLLLDDIDRGLHLAAQAKLIGVLRELMTRDPELQIVCTTHSPYLLDLFEPADVRVLALDSARRTHARPLTEHPEFGKWRFGTQTGELWAALGESWVTEGTSG